MYCSFRLRSARLGKDRTRTGKVTRDGHVSEVRKYSYRDRMLPRTSSPAEDEPLGGVMELYSYAYVWYRKSRAA